MRDPSDSIGWSQCARIYGVTSARPSRSTVLTTPSPEPYKTDKVSTTRRCRRTIGETYASHHRLSRPSVMCASWNMMNDDGLSTEGDGENDQEKLEIIVEESIKTEDTAFH